MNKFMQTIFTRKLLISTLALLGIVFINACSEDSNKGADNLSLDMDLPASMTGGKQQVATGISFADRPLAKTPVGVQQDVGEPCFFKGDDDEDPFENGYDMTKFMVSAVAEWTCVADLVMNVTNFIAHDGLIKETDNDKSSNNYDPEEPTHFSISDISESQVGVNIYYGFTRDVPPTFADKPQFFVSWTDDNNGNINGRLVIDALAISIPDRDPENPITMRMDFNHSVTSKVANMYLNFDNGNQWADGLRIEVTKDLTANPLTKVFVARGLMDMKRQFIAVPGVIELPVLKLYTVSDQLGEGAAIADFNAVAVPLVLNAITGNHLGNYLFDKTDKYFFDADQSVNEPWDYINKSFTTAAYRSGRTTPATGGTLNPFDPSLDLVISELDLDADYFTNTKCENIDDDCVLLLDAIFADGFAGQQPNQGADPLDWRSDAIANPVYL
ncbi:MAG: hypothetical protein GXP08_12310, partial [Gammaproteobacteria bacterium]|nr:hypothetical protein [Gammaproteobacteria bacterium]